MDSPQRTSTRSNKGKPPLPFNWTPHGKCWTVESKQVILPRQIGGTRVHLTPRAQIKKSGIKRAGKGLFLRQGVPRAGLILAEYKGKIISIHDADILQALVLVPLACVQNHTLCLQSFFISHLFSHLSCVPKGKATHVIHIGDSIWCIDSAISDEYPMEWYVDAIGVAGFANTKSRRADCNARTVNNRVFLVSTKAIGPAREVFAFYKRLDARR